ncbi:MAG: NAD-dependent epimerase/dehydratase family protein [Actinomycetota bacterium]|nr:NAD-dependent epimerase/dehydratase family protein [Actinomycetota bacterium]
MSRIVDTSRRAAAETPAEAPAADAAPRRDGDEALIGVVNYFHIHDGAAVERVVRGLEKMDVTHVRTAVSWYDWETEGGPEWYEWVFAQLCSRFSVLPCLLYTPPAKGVLPKTSSPPRDPEDYGRFVDLFLSSYPGAFEHVELWNEPNNYIEWDWTVDPEWNIFARMIASGAGRAHAHGVDTVLGGMSPLDPNWLNLMFLRGAMRDIDVVGIHGFPGTWEAVWEGWGAHVARVQEVLDRHSSPAEVWITECGFSTWAHDEFRQLQTLVDVMDAPVPRAYWYSAEDLDSARETLDGFHCDERAYHFGLHRRDGTPKLSARIWGGGGLAAVRQLSGLCLTDAVLDASSPGTLVTGGAGTLGSALVERLAAAGRHVVVLDNLSRPGSEHNLRRLKESYPELVRGEIGDVRDPFAIRRSLEGCDEVFHLAATSPRSALLDPPLDLAVNLQGTMNLLEEARRMDDPPALVYASSLEIYEPGLNGVPIAENQPLSFQGIGACSKGGADQYVLRYGSVFGFPTIVFRLGCVYGSEVDEDPWLESALRDAATIAIRDLLYVDDAVAALLLARENHGALSGGAYNIGGGAANAVRLADLREEPLGAATANTGDLSSGGYRSYVADTAAFSTITGWRPTVGAGEVVSRLMTQLRPRPDERSLEA